MKRLLLLLMVLTALPAAAETFNIEIDYMVDTSAVGGHSHMPTQAEIDAVVQMFACQGHVLNVLVDDQLTHYDLLRIDPAGQAGFFEYDGSADTFAKIKEANFDNTQGGWHYAVFGHQYERVDSTGTIVPSGSSGLGERPGDDFIVTLGTFTGETGTPFDKASTLAHEFGHNLGLTHCGGQNCSSTGPSTPIMASIMSYDYQLEGVRFGLLCNGLIPESAGDLFKDLDYSGGRMATLQEAALDEALGTTFRSVDWDCSGSIGGVVAQDLSTDGPTWCDNDGPLDLIGDYDEWDLIVDVTKNAKAADLRNMPVSEECISAEEVQERRNKANCGQATLATESCVSSEVWFVDTGTGSPVATGSWKDPSDTVDNAQNAAPAGSALVLFPGTYDEGGTGGVVLDRPVRIYSATSAVIK